MYYCLDCFVVFFFFKQKTAYEMRISDWSSDVCSSDLDFVHAGYDLDAAAILLCESDGTALEVEDEIVKMNAVLTASGATRLEASQDEAQRLRFWRDRKRVV